MAGENKYIICCDFDGVLNSYKSGWQGAAVISDPPVPGAMEWLDDMSRDAYFEIAVYSSRSKEPGGVEAMRAWLGKHLYELWATASHPLLSDAEIRVRVGEVMDALTFPTQKPAASMTIDDRAFCFEGTFPTVKWLKAFKPWNKK
jgi:trehalose-6-phosphatase